MTKPAPVLRGPYTDLKAVWHLDRIGSLRYKARCKPVGLQLILSDLCNHGCVWCAYRAADGVSRELFAADMDDGRGFSSNPRRMLPPDRVREIVDDFAGMGGKSITWTGGGEPTVHPQHLDLIEYALNYGIDCALNTNGIILWPGWEEVIPRLAYVRISIDAGNEEEYGRLHQCSPAQYRIALDNCSKYVRECPHTTIGVGYVVSPENYTNLVEGVRRIRDTGVAYCRLAAVLSTKGIEPYRETYFAIVEVVRAARSLETKTFAVYDLFGDCIGDLEQMAPEYCQCRFQQLVVYIGADLGVYRCCSSAYTTLGLIGSLKTMRFREWLESAEAHRAYTDFDARKCVFCQWNQRNRTLNALIDQPPHVNFL